MPVSIAREPYKIVSLTLDRMQETSNTLFSAVSSHCVWWTFLRSPLHIHMWNLLITINHLFLSPKIRFLSRAASRNDIITIPRTWEPVPCPAGGSPRHSGNGLSVYRRRYWARHVPNIISQTPSMCLVHFCCLWYITECRTDHLFMMILFLMLLICIMRTAILLP